MPIMKPKEFRKHTEKWFSLRNGAIGRIDKALIRYDADRSNRASLLDLQRAVNEFKTEKDNKFAPKGGNFAMSKREHSGYIALLSSQVDAEVGSTAPARPVGVNMLAGIAADARLRAIVRQQNAAADATQVSVDVSERLDYRNGTISNPAWRVKLELNETPTLLVVRVAVKTAGAAPATAFKEAWQAQIAGAWNGAQLVIPGRARGLDIRFELDWKPANYGGEAYTVNVHQPPPRPAEGQYARVGQGQWAQQQRGPTVGRDVGTPDMANWGADDRAAIIHEFGHMIGAPDEYYTTHYNGATVPADTYDQVPFTTNSIMNNTGPEGRIFPRHYHLIKQEYERWKNLTANSTRVIRTG